MRVARVRASLALRLLTVVALLGVALPSRALSACGGDCGADLAAAPKTVEKYVKKRLKALTSCGKRANPMCPTTCPVPDATAAPYVLSATCAALIDCNLEALVETAYDTTWDDAGVCALAPATSCGTARAQNAGKLVGTKLKRRRTSKIDKFPNDLATCSAKIVKVAACDPGVCATAGDWIDQIFPLTVTSAGFQRVPFSVAGPGETVGTLTITANAADWGLAGAESVVLGYDLDGTHLGTIVVYGGATPTQYRILLGAPAVGEHVLGVRHEKDLSPAKKSSVSITAAISVDTIAPPDTRYDFTRFAPVLLGIDTDLNAVGINGVGNATSDTPLIVYATAVPGAGFTTYRYTMIWSNEDGGTGSVPDVLMARYGRTTDIEGILEVDVSDVGVLTEVRYRPDESGTLATFAGTYQGTHPIIRTSTANGLIAADGASTLQFRLAPFAYDDTGLPRELGMDLDPISYVIMTKEIIREGKTEPTAHAATLKLSDPRNYLYVDYNINVSLSGQVLRGVATVGGVTYYSDHAQPIVLALNPRVESGVGRLAIELPPGTLLADIQQYGMQGIGSMSGTLVHADAFLLDADALPGPHLSFDGPLVESGINPFWLITP